MTLMQGCMSKRYMSAHFERENSIQDNMAHEAVIVCGLGDKTPGYLFVLMGPGSKIVEQSRGRSQFAIVS